MRRCVVKLGGDVLGGARLEAIAEDVAGLAESTRVTLVHGGGPQTTALQRRLGQAPNVVAGRRITDRTALEALKMAVAGATNVDLCAALFRAGVRPIGLHGASSGVIRGLRRPPRIVTGGGPEPIDFGHVGDVDGFDVPLLELLAGAGYVPVLACLAATAEGEVLNINADVVATRLACTLRAEDLVLVTGVPGVLADVSDPASRIPRLTLAAARKLIDGGTVAGGMIPKLEESFRALERGVARVHLVDGDLARSVSTPGTVGTLLSA